MGAIEAISLEEPLTAADAEGALPLSAEAGWNQTAEDWRFMLREGRGVGVREARGAGSEARSRCLSGERSSWISMVLVAKDARRRGIGTRLLRRAIEEVRERGRIAGLDATELGRPVYLPLGFRDLYAISRAAAGGAAHRPREPPAGCTIRRSCRRTFRAVAAFDAPRSAMRRGHVLAYLFDAGAGRGVRRRVGGARRRLRPRPAGAHRVPDRAGGGRRRGGGARACEPCAIRRERPCDDRRAGRACGPARLARSARCRAPARLHAHDSRCAAGRPCRSEHVFALAGPELG